MKYSTLSVVAFILLSVVGCAYSFRDSSYDDGFDFPSENVKKILKGKTTADELIQMLGGPRSKYEISENEEEWIYFYATGNQFESRGFLTDQVQQSTRHYKVLNIRIKNGTIMSFYYTEGSEPYGSAQAH